MGTKIIWACRARAGRNKFEYQMAKCLKLKGMIWWIVWQEMNLHRPLKVLNFEFLSFDIVSSFVLRISNLCPLEPVWFRLVRVRDSDTDLPIWPGADNKSGCSTFHGDCGLLVTNDQ